MEMCPEMWRGWKARMVSWRVRSCLHWCCCRMTLWLMFAGAHSCPGRYLYTWTKGRRVRTQSRSEDERSRADGITGHRGRLHGQSEPNIPIAVGYAPPLSLVANASGDNRARYPQNAGQVEGRCGLRGGSLKEQC